MKPRPAISNRKSQIANPLYASARERIDAMTAAERAKLIEIHDTQSRTRAKAWLVGLAGPLAGGDLDHALEQARPGPGSPDAPLPVAKGLAGPLHFVACSTRLPQSRTTDMILACTGIRCTIRVLSPGSPGAPGDPVPPGPTLTLPDGRTLADVRLIDPASLTDVQRILDRAGRWLADKDPLR